ncbi:gliding motility protein RemB [Flavobacterium sp.]|uniref:gliding motility protein RemB n=1 Tax=Flavobacterium sp. TaxID=239 RepID=UPI002FDA9B27
MKNRFVLLLFLCFHFLSAQEKQIEQFPVFSDCENLINTDLEQCFYKNVQKHIFKEFAIPDNVVQSNYKGSFIVLFEVNQDGEFKVQYVDAPFSELADESKRVFNLLPKIAPPTYAGKPTYSRYSMRISIPLQNPDALNATQSKEPSKSSQFQNGNKDLTEYEEIKYETFQNPHFKSNLNIPFSHSLYAQFESSLQQIGSNNHTASKPFTYTEVGKYFDFEQNNSKISKAKEGWWGRKFWNEHLVSIQGDSYWFTVNPILDLRMGKSDPGTTSYTYQNTRGIQIQGGLGSQLNFTTSIYESQGRFADYYNAYAESIRPSGGNPAIIPGIGIAKEFKTDAYDFPLAEANLTYTPNAFINLQLGYGRNFIGDGYRSLLMSDGASPYPSFKINTTFWKIKYTNTYMWLKDVRPEVTEDGTYATKYMANHYLSWNVSKRLNLGFFESVIWTNTNERGFDASFVNPLIFFRTVEFTSSSKSGNALLGLTSKYKWSNQMHFYGQFLLDEFALSDVKAGNRSWRNKFGYQIGAKYLNAFSVPNLLLQLEYNHIRPYVYSHSNAITNYGHNNQSLGHQWGGNAKEWVGIARYFRGRWFADAKLTYGVRGLDFDTEENSFNFGSNIYKNYDENRPFDEGVSVGQGNKTTIIIADFQLGYVVNPTSNLKLFGNLIYRNFDPSENTVTTFKQNTTWFSIGIRSDLFNWYFDY